jgi:hypothetical protein
MTLVFAESYCTSNAFILRLLEKRTKLTGGAVTKEKEEAVDLYSMMWLAQEFAFTHG